MSNNTITAARNDLIYNSEVRVKKLNGCWLIALPHCFD